MPQFMHCFLYDSAEIRLAQIQMGLTMIESVGRYDASFSADLRFAVNMGQNWDEQVNMAECQYFDSAGRRFGCQLLKDWCRVILFSIGIQSK